MTPLRGDLSFSSLAATVSEQLRRPVDGSVDLAGVTRIDSAGAALLLEFARRSGGRLQLHNANEQVRRLLHFYELDEVLTLVS